MAENPPLSLRPNYSQTRPGTDICRTGLHLTDFAINEPGVKLRAAGKVSKATMVSLLERPHRPTGQFFVFQKIVQQQWTKSALYVKVQQNQDFCRTGYEMIAYDLSQGIDFSGHKQYYIQVAYPQPKKRP
ncbi:hypothetical protein [Succinimonas sp.]|uniref:hypothetical protein n=1 Tax=Succinimonas sp. TaxID=1936151 RepID=UPI003865440A